ncbi:MAG: hypothetical protein KDE27_28765 [Planctomycetes bacterium]|nr:hypothetical protein [Planctomycetota bacterium]
MNRFSAATVFPLLALGLPLAAQEHDLHLDTKVDASVWIRQVSTQSQKIDMGIQEVETENVMDVAAKIVVTAVGEDGGVTVECSLQRVRGKFDMPQMGEFPFDSIDAGKAEAKKPDDGFDDFGGMMPDFAAIGRAAAAVAGTKFIVKLDRYGHTESVEGTEAALEQVEQAAGPMGGQMLTGAFGEEAIGNLVESAFGERPDKPTAVGGEWAPRNKNADDRTKADIVMTLQSVSDKSFAIAGKGTIEKAADPAGGADAGDESDEAAMAREMRENMSIENGKITFRSVVSREDGFLVEAERETSMDVKMPGPFGGDIKMQHKSTTSTKRTTEAAAMQRDAKADKAGDGDK